VRAQDIERAAHLHALGESRVPKLEVRQQRRLGRDAEAKQVIGG
jgi:hypothetical protein